MKKILLVSTFGEGAYIHIIAKNLIQMGYFVIPFDQRSLGAQGLSINQIDEKFKDTCAIYDPDYIFAIKGRGISPHVIKEQPAIKINWWLDNVTRFTDFNDYYDAYDKFWVIEASQGYPWMAIGIDPEIHRPQPYTERHESDVVFCVPKDSIIVGYNTKEIFNCNVGDKALSERGIVNINKIFQRYYAGNIYKIKPMCLLPFEITPHHPIKVAITEKKYIPELKRKGKYAIKRKIKEIVWKYPSNITKNDFLIFPKLKTEIHFNNISVKKYYSSRPSRKLIDTIPINEETAELWGYYVAEGSSSDGCAITFGGHETKLADRCTFLASKYFPYKVGKIEGKNTITIRFGGSLLSKFLKGEFGYNAKDKQIPYWILFNKPEILKSFIIAYFKGDGCITGFSRNDEIIKAATVSKKLALQLQLAFSKFNILVHIITEHNTGFQNDNYIYYTIGSKRNIMFDFFNISIRKKKFSQKYHIEDNKNFYVPIKNIEVSEYEGDVYNLATASETYLLSNIIVHNCGTGHPKRTARVENILRNLPFKTTIIGNSWENLQDQRLWARKAVYFQELYKHYYGSKMILNVHYYPGITPNMRSIEAPASSRPMISDTGEGLEECLTPGIDYIPYDNIHEARYLIRKYMEEPEERNKIGVTGQRKVYKDFSIKNILKKMIG